MTGDGFTTVELRAEYLLGEADRTGRNCYLLVPSGGALETDNKVFKILIAVC